MVSWLKFFVLAINKTLIRDKTTVLLIVSNPPFLSAIGWICSVLRGQKYYLLIYDIYPEILIGLNKINKNGLIANIWRYFNKCTWNKAEKVYTIGNYMAENISKTVKDKGKVKVVKVWADINFIKPKRKEENLFVKSLGWENRTIILYSGNLGETHSLNVLLTVAEKMQEREDIGFLIIGTGSKWAGIKDNITNKSIKNIIALPFQPENRLNETLTAGDISVVSMNKGVSGYLIPSKTFYYMAAGSAILGLTNFDNEVGEIIIDNNCGLVIEPSEEIKLERELIELIDDKKRLQTYKYNSRKAAEKYHTRDNTKLIIEDILNENHNSW